jgi:serine phosphatase RsbU (regulator of sigma subunit)
MKTTAFSYTIFGVCFGFCFPIFSLLLDMLWVKGMAFSVANLMAIHFLNPLHFVIDTAPFFLGLAFGIAGMKQDKVIDYHEKLEAEQQKTVKALQENEKIITEQNNFLESTVAIRTIELSETNEELKQLIEELQATIELTNTQKEKIEAQHQNITASIRYGRTIQQTILPTDSEILQNFQDIFIIYKPKDIVSGDFYWFVQTETYSFFAVADCTGHGVPGGFMSMLGTAILNEAVAKNHLTSPHLILEYLHQKIRIAAKKNEKNTADGMDIALCRFEKIDNTVTQLVFSGAKSDVLYSCHEAQELTYIEGDRQAIGGDSTHTYKPYTNISKEISANDMLYFYTDGFIDQASPTRKRFGSKNLFNIITQCYHLPLTEQKEHYLTALKNHQANEPQRDDVTLIGIKI